MKWGLSIVEEERFGGRFEVEEGVTMEEGNGGRGAVAIFIERDLNNNMDRERTGGVVPLS